MFKSQISDAQALELFRKYEQDIIKSFVEAVNDNEDYSTSIKKVNQFGIWEEIFCQVNERAVLDLVIESIEDSIGVEEYNIKVKGE